MTAALRFDRLAAMRSSAATLTVLGLVGGAALGAVSAYRLQYGVVALVVALLGLLVIRRPAFLAVIALVGVFAVQRVGSASSAPGSRGGISYSDALLFIAAVLAIPAVVRTPECSRLRVALLGLAAYLSCLLPTVILHRYTAGYLEWMHRLVLVGGSLLVGAWIARERLTRVALRWLVLVGCVVAVLAIEDTLSNSLLPATPLGYNKNFVGALLGSILVVTALAPAYLGIGTQLHRLATLLVAGGLVASQSRGGMLAAAAGLLVAFMLDPRGHSRQVRRFSILVAVILAGVAAFSVRHQLNQTQADLNNGSIGIRFNVERVTRDLWRTSRVDGIGLKYFNTGNFGRFALPANNVVDNELAESGVVGLIGFTVLQVSLLAAGVRRRRSSKLVAVAVGIVCGALLHGMVDVYWTAGALTLPFMIMGIALATTSQPGASPADDRPRHARSQSSRRGADVVGASHQ